MPYPQPSFPQPTPFQGQGPASTTLKRPSSAPAQATVDKRPYGFRPTRSGPTQQELEAVKESAARLERELHAQRAVAQSLQHALQTHLKAPPGLTNEVVLLPNEANSQPIGAESPLIEPMEQESPGPSADNQRQGVPIKLLVDSQSDDSVSDQGDFKPVVYKGKNKSVDHGPKQEDHDQKPQIPYKKKPIPKHLK